MSHVSTLETVAGIPASTRVTELRGGRWQFQGYSPDFVYRYRPAPLLNPSQFRELALHYLDRAAQFLE